MKIRTLSTPLSASDVESLKAGDEVLLSGIIYTARDAAHQRLASLLRRGKRLPIDFRDQVIYYAGPTPARRGRAVGSCGPTTSSRMDLFTPDLLAAGLRGMIGKGERSAAVRAAIKKHKAVYLLATGGLGALLSERVRSSEVILFGDLGPEAVRRMVVEDFPLIVGIDTKGRDVYEKAEWKKAGRA